VAAAEPEGFLMSKAVRWIVITGLLIGLSACGGLRYSEVSPEAQEFRPRTIAVFPADAKTFPEAKGLIDSLFAEVLTETGWFDAVTGGEAIERRLATDEPLRRTVVEYLAKIDRLSFSDPLLSGRIGEMTAAEALFLVRVDYWNYTVEKDKKLGKVSLSLWMIEAKTGKFIWKASHTRASDYLIIRPELAGVARSLIREMVGHLPR
jgi:hypothetical protein